MSLQSIDTETDDRQMPKVKSLLLVSCFSLFIGGCVSVEQLRTNIDLSLDDKPRMNSVIVLKKKQKEED